MDFILWIVAGLFACWVTLSVTLRLVVRREFRRAVLLPVPVIIGCFVVHLAFAWMWGRIAIGFIDIVVMLVAWSFHSRQAAKDQEDRFELVQYTSVVKKPPQVNEARSIALAKTQGAEVRSGVGM